jgi:hypothetical protein
MAIKQKPDPKVVKKSAKELPAKGAKKIEKAEDARILADQRYAPKPHKPKPKGKRY